MPGSPNTATRTGNPKQRQKAQAADEAASSREITQLGEGYTYGNLTQDVELRYTPSGLAVCDVRIAYTPRIKDDDSGEWSDGETEYFDLVCWRQQAENAAASLIKGDRVVAFGAWRKEEWTYDGVDHERIKMDVREIGPSLLFREVTVKRTQRSKTT